MQAREPAFDLSAAVRCPPSGRITFEAFHDWLDEDTWAEWVDGEVQVLLPSSYRHADLVRFLLAVLSYWVEAHDLGVVIAAPFLMRLPPPVGNGREPDLLFVAQSHRERLRATYLDGPADLVVEVLSPESVERDRKTKFAEYAQAGIPEYWMLDPEGRLAEVYRLGPDGRYRIVFAGFEGSYECPMLHGFRLPVHWLWQEPLPRLQKALQDLGLIA
jgi:Uma2 family endonuclease